MQACCFFHRGRAAYGVGGGIRGSRAAAKAAKTKLLQSTLSKLKGNAEHTTHSGVVCLKSQTALINVFIFIANSMINLLFFFTTPFSFLK